MTWLIPEPITNAITVGAVGSSGEGRRKAPLMNFWRGGGGILADSTEWPQGVLIKAEQQELISLSPSPSSLQNREPWTQVLCSGGAFPAASAAR